VPAYSWATNNRLFLVNSSGTYQFELGREEQRKLMANAGKQGTATGRRQVICRELRRRLEARQFGNDKRLTERRIAGEFSVCRLTARQALQELVRSGHLQVAPRRGYWPSSPLSGTTAPRIAFVKAGTSGAPGWSRQLGAMWHAIQEVIVESGGTVTAIGEPEPGNGRLARRLADIEIDGVILDCAPGVVAEIAGELRQPCVVVNTPIEAGNADVLVQDNATGGYLAGRHVLDLGHERICWLGWPTSVAHGRERFGGFLAAMAERDRQFDLSHAAFVKEDDPRGLDEAVARLLAGRPTAIVVLWAAMAARVVISARKAGLALPDDLRLVTWGAVEGFPERWRAYCGRDEPLPDAIHWRMRDMVDAALSRLAERIRNPISPPVKLFLPVHLECRGSCGAAVSLE
jgi:DNA-binding LacI/PurR family transcriptional regulator